MLLKAKAAVIAVFYFWTYLLNATTQLNQPAKLCLPDLVHDKHLLQEYLANNTNLPRAARKKLCTLVQISSALPKPEIELLSDHDFKYQALKHIKALIQQAQHQRKASFFAHLTVFKENECS